MEDIYIDPNYSCKNLKAALCTLKASRWELFKVHLFGRKSISADGKVKITTMRYKGKTYLVDYREH